MTVRTATPDDFDQIAKIHGGPDVSGYPLPDLSDGTFWDVTVLLDRDGCIVMACAARKTAEMFLLADGKWQTPALRLEAFRSIHADMLDRLKRHKVNDAHALLPCTVAKSFGRRLKQFGWWKPTWPLWARRIT